MLLLLDILPLFKLNLDLDSAPYHARWLLCLSVRQNFESHWDTTDGNRTSHTFIQFIMGVVFPSCFSPFSQPTTGILPVSASLSFKKNLFIFSPVELLGSLPYYDPPPLDITMFFSPTWSFFIRNIFLLFWTLWPAWRFPLTPPHISPLLFPLYWIPFPNCIIVFKILWIRNAYIACGHRKEDTRSWIKERQQFY